MCAKIQKLCRNCKLFLNKSQKPSLESNLFPNVVASNIFNEFRAKEIFQKCK